MPITETYREHKIEYAEVLNVWRSEDFADKPSLVLMREAIDRSLEPKKEKFNPVQCIVGRFGFYHAAVLVGICEDGGKWINVAGIREKIRPKCGKLIYKFDGDKLKEIENHLRIRNAAAEQVDKIVRTLEPL